MERTTPVVLMGKLFEDSSSVETLREVVDYLGRATVAVDRLKAHIDGYGDRLAAEGGYEAIDDDAELCDDFYAREADLNDRMLASILEALS